MGQCKGAGSRPPADRNTSEWLVGGGEIGKVVRAKDWTASPLGPIASWPQSLRTTVSLCLASNFPISLAWGPGHVQIYNDGYWPICGEKHPHSLGQDFRECWGSAWPVIGEAFERGLQGETSFLESQRMFLDRNGYLEETFFTFSFSPIRDETGGIGGLFHPVTEVTSRMLAERRTRALRDLAARTADAQSGEGALNLAAKSLAECDRDVPFVLCYVLDAGRREARLIASAGLSPGVRASSSLLDLDATDGADWPVAQVARSGQAERIDDLEARFGPIGCGPYPESPKSAFALPIHPPGGEGPIAILIAGVSPRLPVNEAYRAFYDLVANSVTLAVASASAYEAERQRAEALAEIERAKTAFFSNVSHEFRTPLTLMLGPLEDELAERDMPLPPERHERLATAHRNSLRLLKLVNTLLDFSRVEAGRSQARFEPIDLAALTTDLASVFRSAIEKAGLTLVLDCAPLPEPVHVDREMWEKIVLNLLSNALKHTFEGGIRVALHWRGDHAELVVADSGIGIPKAELPRLFERFHRVKDARSGTHEGTGIGLALVRHLAELHGGGVEIESEEGAGSTFRVSIRSGMGHLPQERLAARGVSSSPPVPVDAYVEESLHWLRRDPATPSDGPSGAPRPRVLLVDDNADMREYVRRLLAARYDVLAVGDGLAALAAVRERPPDLVLSDVMMPGLDGFGLLRALRANDTTRAIPVILLSARAGEDASVEGLDVGADDYLVKPFSARELLARVRANLELARVRIQFAEEVKIRQACQQAEEALRSSEARLRRLVDTSIVGMMVVNLSDRRVSQANDAFLSIVGYSRDEVGAIQIGAITPPHWENADREAMKQMQESGVAPLREKEYTRKDGSRAQVLVGAAMLDGTDCVAFVVNISERKRTELALQKSQAQLAALYASGVIGIVGSDETGRITEANDAFLGTVGYSRADLVAGSLNWVAMTPPQWRKQRNTALAQVSARGFADPWKQECVRKDGCRVLVLAGIAATDEKNTIGFVADLTERRLAEEARSRLEEEAQVETAGRERAEQALRQMEEQFRQAQKMEAVGRLAGGVAHDFNNILSVVLTNSEMLLDDIAPESPLRAQVEQIRLAGKRAADLTRQLLMFSRKQVLEPKVLDLNRLLSSMDKMLRRLVGEDVDMISTPAATLANVLVDRSSIEQVIMNLVVNARDAMPTGGQLAIETANVTLDEACARRHLEVTPGPHVLLAVRDTGVGMDRATQARIFEPFFTTKPMDQGTGLGLSTAFGIVKQSGGSIWVDSEPGKGTTFKVYLPLIEAAVDEERPSTLPPRVLSGSETILLVEDEDHVRSAARGILRRQHYHVVDAKNGNEALLLCEQHAGIIDLLLTDVVMPNMSGVELARRIAAIRPVTKVLFMSGYTDDAVIRHGAVGTGITFVQKPFTTEMLARKVRQVLDTKPENGS
jgi:PAS domain S-box-containing protein